MPETTPPKRRPWLRWAVLIAPSYFGLAAVLIAIAFGYAPKRLWPVASFLALWAIAGTYVVLAFRALRRRAYRLRTAVVPRGVRLTTPAWIIAERILTMAGVFAIAGTLVAALGFPGIAVGILLVFGGFLAIAASSGFSIAGVRALTFEETGLRFHIGAAACVVPWGAIGTVDAIGPAHSAMTRISLPDVNSLLDRVTPDTPKNRERVKAAFSDGYVLLEAWAAGLDARTLVRTIREATAGTSEQLN